MRSISIWKTAPTAGVLVLGISAANAADVRGAPPLPPLLENAPPLLVDEFSSGWYLRGDIGYRMNKVDDVTNAGPFAVTDSDLGNSWLIGAGVGYKWEWFRTDLTVDYGTKSKFSAGSGIQPDDYSARIDSVTGLLNIYGDLGTWYGFTPYIGAGAGVAYLQAANFGLASVGGVDADSTNSWNFAWALMAGVSYRVTPNALIDVGYRYVNMGDIATGVDPIGNQLTFKKLTSDELRLGFRYVLD